MRAIVTGGAGFVGSHLVEHLLAQGWDVLALDRQQVPQNLNGCLGKQGYAYRLCDLSQAGNLDWLAQGGERFDAVFHLAGWGEMLASLENPAGYVQANVVSTAHALELARNVGAKRFVYAASSSCYGAHPPVPTDEGAPIDLTHPYALSKYLGEECVRHWGRVYGLETVCLRLFTAYGPRMRRSDALGPVLNIFLAQKANGLPLTIVGDGTQGRDFVHARDVARAFELAATVDSAIVADGGDLFNIGAGETQTINHIAACLGGPVVHIPDRHGDPHTARANIARAAWVLGWQPQVAFDDGLGEMLNRLEDWADAPVWTPDIMAQATARWQELLK